MGQPRHREQRRRPSRSSKVRSPWFLMSNLTGITVVPRQQITSTHSSANPTDSANDGTRAGASPDPIQRTGREQRDQTPLCKPIGMVRSRGHVCNLYAVTKGQQAIRELTRAMFDRTGNLPPLPGIFPDYSAPIVRNTVDGRELAMARWGMPSPIFAMKGRNSDPGVTNVATPPHPTGAGGWPLSAAVWCRSPVFPRTSRFRTDARR